MEFFDTHCHIQSSDRPAGIPGEATTRALWDKAGFPGGAELIGRAVKVGVNRMVCVGCDISDSRLAVDFVQGKPECWASIGIHPHESGRYTLGDKLDRSALDEFAGLATTPKVVAVGECGLDYYYEHSSPAAQEPILRFQIELALRHDLPIIFHVREAFKDFWPIFDSYEGIRGVLHSFTDNSVNMEKALARGLYIGVNGIATFVKNPEQREMYKTIPLSRILLETDSPFLTPHPYRGKICEPYHTSVTAEYVAKLRNKSLEELAAATTVNARNLFNV